VEALLQAGETVRVLDDLSSGLLDNLSSASANGRLNVTVGSVCDLPLFRRQMEGCGQVYHLAASVGVALVTAHASECLRNNVEGVQNLFAAVAAQPSPPRVILFSSSEVYGKSDQLPLREDGDLVLGPSHVSRWSYASGKVTGEFLALSEHARSGVPVTVVRCFNTCGPRQRSAYGMVVPRFLDQALAGEPITVYGDGLQTRCFSYVGDVVQGVLRLAECGESVGEIYNIGSDRETTIQELAERVVALAQSPSSIRKVPYDEVFGESFQDVRRRVPDLSKIRGRIGQLPMADLDTLLRSTLVWRKGRPASSVDEAGTAPRPSASPAV
jgi:UDP-glucose 4-epimerase